MRGSRAAWNPITDFCSLKELRTWPRTTTNRPRRQEDADAAVLAAARALEPRVSLQEAEARRAEKQRRTEELQAEAAAARARGRDGARAARGRRTRRRRAERPRAEAEDRGRRRGAAAIVSRVFASLAPAHPSRRQIVACRPLLRRRLARSATRVMSNRASARPSTSASMPVPTSTSPAARRAVSPSGCLAMRHRARRDAMAQLRVMRPFMQCAHHAALQASSSHSCATLSPATFALRWHEVVRRAFLGFDGGAKGYISQAPDGGGASRFKLRGSGRLVFCRHVNAKSCRVSSATSSRSMSAPRRPGRCVPPRTSRPTQRRWHVYRLARHRFRFSIGDAEAASLYPQHRAAHTLAACLR